MHWNASIGPDKWPIFGRFPTLFALKRPARHEKNTSNMADVRRWRHRVTSLQVLYNWEQTNEIALSWMTECRYFYYLQYMVHLTHNNTYYSHKYDVIPNWSFALPPRCASLRYSILKGDVFLLAQYIMLQKKGNWDFDLGQWDFKKRCYVCILQVERFNFSKEWLSYFNSYNFTDEVYGMYISYIATDLDMFWCMEVIG
jgi:hypothetical protein